MTLVLDRALLPADYLKRRAPSFRSRDSLGQEQFQMPSQELPRNDSWGLNAMVFTAFDGGCMPFSLWH